MAENTFNHNNAFNKIKPTLLGVLLFIYYMVLDEDLNMNFCSVKSTNQFINHCWPAEEVLRFITLN